MPDFAGNAPALEILAQVVTRPDDDDSSMGLTHKGSMSKDASKEKAAKRKYSESSVASAWSGPAPKSSQRESSGYASFMQPVVASWSMDSISGAGLYRGAGVGGPVDGRPMLLGMENPPDQTMLFLAANTHNEQLTGSGVGTPSFVSIPGQSSHQYDMSALMGGSTVMGPGHMSLPAAGAWSGQQHQSMKYILPKDAGMYGAPRPPMPFTLHPNAFALSPRDVISANTPTLLNSMSHISPASSPAILQPLSSHMGGSDGQLRDSSYLPYTPSSPSGVGGGVGGGNLSDAAFLLLGVAGHPLPPVKSKVPVDAVPGAPSSLLGGRDVTAVSPAEKQ
jgi:hypothetical protein